MLRNPQTINADFGVDVSEAATRNVGSSGKMPRNGPEIQPYPSGALSALAKSGIVSESLLYNSNFAPLV